MGWSQPGGGCGDVHRTTVLSGALERHQLASAPPSRRCWMAVLPIPPPSRTSAMGEAKWGGMRMRNRRADATAATKSYSCTSLRPSALVRRSRGYRPHRRCCDRAGGRTTTVRGTACDRSRRSYGRGWRGRWPRPFP
jgi:hypothetical protein